MITNIIHFHFQLAEQFLLLIFMESDTKRTQPQVNLSFLIKDAPSSYGKYENLLRR